VLIFTQASVLVELLAMFVIFHFIKVKKLIQDPCCHLTSENVS